MTSLEMDGLEYLQPSPASGSPARVKSPSNALLRSNVNEVVLRHPGVVSTGTVIFIG